MVTLKTISLDEHERIIKPMKLEDFEQDKFYWIFLALCNMNKGFTEQLSGGATRWGKIVLHSNYFCVNKQTEITAHCTTEPVWATQPQTLKSAVILYHCNYYHCRNKELFWNCNWYEQAWLFTTSVTADAFKHTCTAF